MIYYILIAALVFFSFIFVIAKYVPNWELTDNIDIPLVMLLAFPVSLFWIVAFWVVLYWCTKKIIEFAKKDK
jgi:hypothetical protein